MLRKSTGSIGIFFAKENLSDGGLEIRNLSIYLHWLSKVGFSSLNLSLCKQDSTKLWIIPTILSCKQTWETNLRSIGEEYYGADPYWTKELVGKLVIEAKQVSVMTIGFRGTLSTNFINLKTFPLVCLISLTRILTLGIK